MADRKQKLSICTLGLKRTRTHYSRSGFPLSFWRTASGCEVDLILGDAEVAVEIESSQKVQKRTFRSRLVILGTPADGILEQVSSTEL